MTPHTNAARATDGKRFTDFCAAYLRHTKGRWAGKPLVLEPWQREIVSELLRTDDDGWRTYREALIGLPRKNGKSTLASALALYLLVADAEPGAEVYSAAASKEQARIVFGQAREMVLASPRLSDWCKVGRDAITVPSTSGIYRVLSSDAPRQHGLNPSGIIVDELHAHRTDELYLALRTASLAREQPLMVSITTAGWDLDTICGRLYDRGRSDASGDDFCFYWRSIAEDELEDPAAWKRANPASWITLEDLAREARALPRFAFDRWHLNRWTSAEESWLPPGAWDASCNDRYAIEPSDTIVVGVDIGVKHDTSALVWVAPKDGKLVARSHVFAVQHDPDRPPAAHTIAQGERVELELVENKIRDLAREYQVLEVVYDPWRFERSAQALADEGLLLVEFPQTNERMAPASQGLFDAITEGRIVHDGDPVLKAHIEAAAAKDTGRGWRLSKKDAKKPMDAAIGLVMATTRAEANESTSRPSISILA